MRNLLHIYVEYHEYNNENRVQRPRLHAKMHVYTIIVEFYV